MKLRANTFCLACSAAIAFSAFAGADLAQAQIFSFSDTATADPVSGVNFYTTTSGDNAGGSGGVLALSNAQFQLNGNGASLVVQSGSLSLTNTGYGFFVGQNSTGSLDVQGGILTINDSTDSNGFGEQGIFFGNGSGFGTVTQEAGTFNVIGGNQGLIIGRSGGSGSLTLTGGVLDEQDTAGTTFGNSAGFGGTGTLTFGLGSGVFEQTASDTLTFAHSGSYINFLSGSAGQLSLAGASSSYFANLVTSGDILVNGAAATPSDFTYSTSGGQGIYQLEVVTAPEPSTWALLAGGLIGLLAVRRQRRIKA